MHATAGNAAGAHVNNEVVELDALGRLTDECQVPLVEEHLLICSRVRTAWRLRMSSCAYSAWPYHVCYGDSTFLSFSVGRYVQNRSSAAPAAGRCRFAPV